MTLYMFCTLSGFSPDGGTMALRHHTASILQSDRYHSISLHDCLAMYYHTISVS